MKRKDIFFVVAMALILTTAFSGCTALMGKNGNAKLTLQLVNEGYGDFLTMGWQSGSGMENVSSLGIPTIVNPGTWNYYYNVAQVTYTYPYYYYWVDAYAADSSWDYSSSGGNVASVGSTAYDDGYYFTDSITITTNKGTFLTNGVDRNYTLTLEYYTNPAVASRGIALSSRVLVDDATKTVSVYSGDYDTITITHNKARNTAGAKSLGIMAAPHSYTFKPVY